MQARFVWNPRWAAPLGVFVLVATSLAMAGDGGDRTLTIVGDGGSPRVAFVGEEGDGWAIPIGKRTYLGVHVAEETEYEEGGARVTGVVDDSPASRAGIREGDIIVEFDRQTIRGPVSLTTQVHGREPGDRVPVTVVRDGRPVQLDVELASRGDDLQVMFPEGLAPFVDLDDLNFDFDFESLPFDAEELRDRLADLPHLFGPDVTWSCEGDDCARFDYNVFFGSRPRLGVQLVETTPELRRHLGGAEDAGVLVSRIVEDSAAEAAGIRVGDLIVRVGDVTVKNTGELRRALAEAGTTFDVEVVRDGRSQTIPVVIEEPEPDGPSGPRARFVAPAPPVPSAPAALRPAPRVPPRPAPAPAPLRMSGAVEL